MEKNEVIDLLEIQAEEGGSDLAHVAGAILQEMLPQQQAVPKDESAASLDAFPGLLLLAGEIFDQLESPHEQLEGEREDDEHQLRRLGELVLAASGLPEEQQQQIIAWCKQEQKDTLPPERMTSGTDTERQQRHVGVDDAIAALTDIIKTGENPQATERIAQTTIDRGNKTGGNKAIYNSKDRDPMSQYLDEIGLVPLLTADEERELSQIIEKGHEAQEQIDAGDNTAMNSKAVQAGSRAKEQFIRANLRLVVSIVKRYPLPPSMELLDLIQEGNLGLEHAVDKFDWRKGFKFSTYATFWIRQAALRALDQKASLVRLPEEYSRDLRAALREYSADELDTEHAHLHRLTNPTSLDRPLGEDRSGRLGDMIPDNGPGTEELVMTKAEETMVTGLLDVLDPRPRNAVEQRFGLNDGRKRSYREVGEELGATAEAARRLVKRAVGAMKAHADKTGCENDLC